MTFFEEIKKITEKALEEKEKARIETSKIIIQEANEGIRKSAMLGQSTYTLSYREKDCDLSYIRDYYQKEGFDISYSNRKEYIISW